MNRALMLLWATACAVRLDLSTPRSDDAAGGPSGELDNMDPGAEQAAALRDSVVRMAADGVRASAGPWVVGALGVFLVREDGSVERDDTLGGDEEEPTSDARGVTLLPDGRAVVSTARGLTICSPSTPLTCIAVSTAEDIMPDSYGEATPAVAVVDAGAGCIAFYTRSGVGCLDPNSAMVTAFASLESFDANVTGAGPGTWLDRAPWLCVLDTPLPPTSRPHCNPDPTLSPRERVTSGFTTSDTDVIADARPMIIARTAQGTRHWAPPGEVRAMTLHGGFLYFASPVGVLRAAWPLADAATFELVSPAAAVTFFTRASGVEVLLADGTSKRLPD